MSRRSFPAEFKVEAASKVLDEGVSIREACQAFDIGETAMRRWVKQLEDERAGAPTPGRRPISPEQRHQLNRGGDRRANNALWTIPVARMRSDPRTRAYVERCTREGRSSKEIHRCLKRYIVRELYPLMIKHLQAAGAVP